MITKTILNSLYSLADAYLFGGFVEEAVTILARGVTVIDNEPIEMISNSERATLLLHYGTMLNWQSFMGHNQFEDTVSILTQAQALTDKRADVSIQAEVLRQ